MINKSEKRENIAALSLQVCVLVCAHVVDLMFSSRLPGKKNFVVGTRSVLLLLHFRVSWQTGWGQSP